MNPRERKMTRLAESVGAFVTKRQIADLLGVTTRTTTRWLAEGRMPPPDVRINARVIRWKVSSVREFLEKGPDLT